MQEKAGAQISRKAFIQSAGILLVLMIVAGILTRVIPAGSYERTVTDGREIVLPGTFETIPAPEYPVWRWFTAPVEVLGSPDGLSVIMIIVFILLVGGAFAVLDGTGILRASVAGLVRRFAGRKLLLLAVITLFFMLLGALFGVFEEVVPLIPLMITLAYSLGWDSLIGLGMSILATNMGFSAAIANPFTVGVAQQLAGLPLFSGAWLRVLIFVLFYLVLLGFLAGYARRIEARPEASLTYSVDQGLRARASGGWGRGESPPRLSAAIRWFLGFVILILAVLVAAPFIPALSSLTLPLVGILFLAAGLGAGLISGTGTRATLRALGQGILGIAPGIVLILMAVSVKHIVAQGKILDTILHAASQPFTGSTPLAAVLAAFGVTLLIEIFVASGSAKAFLLMPILVPLADLLGLTRQTVVLSYAFGDGFTNMVYPTNAVLLISLGLTVVSYPVWIRWTARLWLAVLVLAIALLALAVAIGYGPF
jgi:uncharacterized ion transporter superfamily protein YfcC